VVGVAVPAAIGGDGMGEGGDFVAYVAADPNYASGNPRGSARH
jgi:hypothetical protein